MDELLKQRIPTVESLDRLERLDEINGIVDNEHKWGLRSQCCKKCIIDDRLLKYLVQNLIIIMVACFSMIKLSISDDNHEVYLSILGTILGLIIPGPQLKQDI